MEPYWYLTTRNGVDAFWRTDGAETMKEYAEGKATKRQVFDHVILFIFDLLVYPTFVTRMKRPAAPFESDIDDEDDVGGHHHQAHLSGTWRLDKERSDSLDPYLSAVGLCQIAIDGHRQKESSTETYYTFEQTPTSLVVTKRFWPGTSRREIFFNRSVNESGQIQRKVQASLVGEAVVVTTDLGQDRILRDIKTIEDDGMKVVLQLVTPEERVEIVRWLVPSELPSQDDEDDNNLDA